MSVESARVLALESSKQLEQLVRDRDSAAARAGKAEPGDRDDVARFEAISTKIELMARSSGEVAFELVPDAGTVPAGLADLPEIVDAIAAVADRGMLPVVIVDSLGLGATTSVKAPVGAPEVLKQWKSVSKKQDPDAGPVREQRLRAQLKDCVDSGGATPIAPSGVNNRVLAVVLRDAAEVGFSKQPIAAPVVYRDGSTASNKFPIGAIQFDDSAADRVNDIELSLALLSIRHTEMDHIVDGAWLRNRDVSKPRKHGLTDDVVYSQTREQLDLLASDGMVGLTIYQTGLEPAIVGFYKGVADHLLQNPGQLVVKPVFYRGDGTYEQGKVWAS